MAEPDEQAGTGRLPDGRFAPGHSGNPAGRPPRGIDFRELVLRARSEKIVEADILSVYEKMLERARAGDVQAAKVVLDRVALPDAPASVVLAEARRSGATLEQILSGAAVRSTIVQVVTGVPNEESAPPPPATEPPPSFGDASRARENSRPRPHVAPPPSPRPPEPPPPYRTTYGPSGAA